MEWALYDPLSDGAGQGFFLPQLATTQKGRRKLEQYFLFSQLVGGGESSSCPPWGKGDLSFYRCLGGVWRRQEKARRRLSLRPLQDPLIHSTQDAIWLPLGAPFSAAQ